MSAMCQREPRGSSLPHITLVSRADAGRAAARFMLHPPYSLDGTDPGRAGRIEPCTQLE